MTQESKQLLLKDLCARLPYLVKGLYQWKDNVPFDRFLEGMLYDELYLSLCTTGDSSFKPYLRPMSSMTEEERDELLNLRMEVNMHKHPWIDRVLDFYLSHHLDWRGLILLGLALEAPADMYKTE